MVDILSPEQALMRIIDVLRERVLFREGYDEIVPAGSVPLGTYVGEPDLDIFIVVDGRTKGVFRALERHWRGGKRKEGELDIWWVHNLYGYDVDFVVIDKNNPKVQTLNHVRYYMDKIDDEFRDKVKWLKQYFKDINCYGAETGGITGICVTRMAEIYESTDDALADMLRSIVKTGKFYIEDPTLKGRNLFASVSQMKMELMILPVNMYLLGGTTMMIDLDYFFKIYPRVYKIKRKRSMGTDKEWQFVYSCVRKTWRQLKSRIRWWEPELRYDILVSPWDIYIGINVKPTDINYKAIEYIPIEKLNDKALKNLKERGAYENEEKSYLLYEREPPFRYLGREFEKMLFEYLEKKYIDVERI